jgi:hypothetical protein
VEINETLNRIKLLMGYDVGIPLNEQTVILDTDKYKESFNKLGDLIDKMSYWNPKNTYSGFNNDVIEYLNILKKLKNLKPSDGSPYNFYSLQTVYIRYFQDSTLVNHACDNERIKNLTPATLIFDTIYLDWLNSLYPNKGYYKSTCLRPSDPLYRFTKPTSEIENGVSNIKDSEEREKTEMGSAENEFNGVFNKLPTEYYTLPIFNYFSNNPFSTVEENNQFRKWFNTRFPKTASIIGLDLTDESKKNSYTSTLKKAVNQIITYGRENLFAYYVYDWLAKKDKTKYIEYWKYFSPKMDQAGEIMGLMNNDKILFIEKSNQNKNPDTINSRLQLLWTIGNEFEKDGITTSIYPGNDWDVDVQWNWSAMQSEVYLQYKPTSEKCGFKIQLNLTPQTYNSSDIFGAVETSLVGETEEIEQEYVANINFKVNGNIIEITTQNNKLIGTYNQKTGNYIDIFIPGYGSREVALDLFSFEYYLKELSLVTNDEKNKDKAEELYDKSQEQSNIRQQAIAMGSNVVIEGELSLNPCYPAFQKKLDELKTQGKNINKKEIRVEAWTEFVKCMDSGLTGQEYNEKKSFNEGTESLEVVLKSSFVLKNWEDEDSINKNSHGAYDEQEVRDAWENNGTKGRSFLINVAKGIQNTQSQNPKVIGKLYWDPKTKKYFIPVEGIPSGGDGAPWYFRFYEAHPIISQIIPTIIAGFFTAGMADSYMVRIILLACVESGINFTAAYFDYKTGLQGDDYNMIKLDIIFALLPFVIVTGPVQTALKGKFTPSAIDGLRTKVSYYIKPGTTESEIEMFLKGDYLSAEEKQVLAFLLKTDNGALFSDGAKTYLGRYFENIKAKFGNPPKLPKNLEGSFKTQLADVVVPKTFGTFKEMAIYISPSFLISKDLGLIAKLGFCYLFNWKNSLDCMEKELSEDEKQKILAIINQLGPENFEKRITDKKDGMFELIIDTYGKGATGTVGDRNKDGEFITSNGKTISELCDELSKSLDTSIKDNKTENNEYCKWPEYTEEEAKELYFLKGIECKFCEEKQTYHCKESGLTTTTTTVTEDTTTTTTTVN